MSGLGPRHTFQRDGTLLASNRKLHDGMLPGGSKLLVVGSHTKSPRREGWKYGTGEW